MLRNRKTRILDKAIRTIDLFDFHVEYMDDQDKINHTHVYASTASNACRNFRIVHANEKLISISAI